MEVASRIVAVVEPTHVAEARRCAAEVTGILAFDEVTRGRVALAVTEAATNLIKHGGGGELFVGITGTGLSRGIQIVAMDHGHGIENVEASLRDGHSTAGTPGTGLGAIRRAATTFDVYSNANGTVVAASIFPNATPPVSVGAVCAPMAGQTYCGDAWAAWSAGELTSILVCDGLGHGAEAAVAANCAIDIFLRHAERSAHEVLLLVHDALRATRGAAVALAELDQRKGMLRYCALGNISGTIVGADGREQRLVSFAGIAGHVMRRLHESTFPWPRGSMLLMHSDGIGTHWSLPKYPGLAARRADVIAGVIYRDHRRQRDDATVVVATHAEAA